MFTCLYNMLQFHSIFVVTFSSEGLFSFRNYLKKKFKNNTMRVPHQVNGVDVNIILSQSFLLVQETRIVVSWSQNRL